MSKKRTGIRTLKKASVQAPKKRPSWQNHSAFLSWAYGMEYAFKDDKGKPAAHSIGVILYCWEAWCACEQIEKGKHT